MQSDRIAAVRRSARLSEALEAFAARALSLFYRDEFPALYMAWGATQELTTLRGYERIIRSTKNAVLRELASRIAPQEGRHFAGYFDSARERHVSRRSGRWLA